MQEQLQLHMNFRIVKTKMYDKLKKAAESAIDMRAPKRKECKAKQWTRERVVDRSRRQSGAIFRCKRLFRK